MYTQNLCIFLYFFDSVPFSLHFRSSFLFSAPGSVALKTEIMVEKTSSELSAAILQSGRDQPPLSLIPISMITFRETWWSGWKQVDIHNEKTITSRSLLWLLPWQKLNHWITKISLKFAFMVLKLEIKTVSRSTDWWTSWIVDDSLLLLISVELHTYRQ